MALIVVEKQGTLFQAFLTHLFIVCFCACVCTCVLGSVEVGSLLIMWVLGIELRVLGLAVGMFTYPPSHFTSPPPFSLEVNLVELPLLAELPSTSPF